MKKALIFFLLGISSVSACKCGDEQIAKNKTTASVDHEKAPVANLEEMSREAGNITAVNKVPGETPPAELSNLYASDKRAIELKEQRSTMLRSGKLQHGFYPEGSDRRLTYQDIQYLTPWGKKIMLSEIYARHGMTFRDEALKRHFSSQSWYKAKGEHIFQELTPIEKQNITFLINILPEEGLATTE